MASFSSKANASRENNSFDHSHQHSNGDSSSHTANNDSNDSNPGKEYTPEQLEAVKRFVLLPKKYFVKSTL